MQLRTILSRQEYPEFESKTVLILGGANGIGRALVEGFSSLGAKVGIIDKNETKAEELAKSLAPLDAFSDFPTFRPRVFKVDLAVEKERTKVLDNAVKDKDLGGPPTTVVSTIGSDRRVVFETVEQSVLEDLTRTNGWAPILSARQLIAPMREAGGGSICLFTSRHGSKICSAPPISSHELGL